MTTVSKTADFYEHNSEWYAALVRATVPDARAALGELMPVIQGAAVEVGAGIGATLDALHSAGASEIHAVEPSPGMRTGMLTRVALDDTLAPITTIHAGTLSDTVDRLPSQWGAFVILNALGHLTDADEEHLWKSIDAHLAPGGRVVIGLQPPFEPAEIPWTDFGSTTVGRHTWHTRGTATTDGDHARWTMEWTMVDDTGAQLDQRSAVSQWRITSPADLTARAADVGLTPLGQIDDLMMYGFARE